MKYLLPYLSPPLFFLLIALGIDTMKDLDPPWTQLTPGVRETTCKVGPAQATIPT